MSWKLNIRVVFDKLGTDEAECSRKVASGRMVSDAISLQLVS